MSLIKKLGMMGPDELFPHRLARQVHKLAKPGVATSHVEPATVISELSGLYAVGKGDNVNQPCLGIISPEKEAKYVLIGKGICYDTGGYNIKTGSHMMGMKFDMLGAATVLECYKKLPPKIKERTAVLIPCANNVVSPHALKPGDYIEYANGMTVEVGNTDAEGRLVLADAIIYAQTHFPKAKLTIDIATLTGAISYALGDELVGVFSNFDITKLLAKANKKTKKYQGWHLPIHESHMEQNVPAKKLKKYFDLSNIALHGNRAGSSNAAAFLAHFYKKTKFIHLDIAGVGDKDGLPTEGGLELLTNLVKEYK